MGDIEYRFAELRFDEPSRKVGGAVVRYDDRAVLAPGIEERINAGAFGDVQEIQVPVTIQHERSRLIGRTGSNATLSDTGKALEMAMTMPQTRDGDDAMTLIRDGILTGISVEMRVEDDVWANRTRTIRRARMIGYSLVSNPAYRKSELELRWEEGMKRSQTSPLRMLL